MKMIKNKLKNKKGETLAETLIAILISALALAALASAVSHSVTIIKTTKEKTAVYYEENNRLTQEEGLPDAVGTVKIKQNGTEISVNCNKSVIDKGIKVDYYINGIFHNNKVVSFAEQTE